MDINELERAAMKNDPMPDGLRFPDQVLYQGLRYLYRQFKAGTISREEGAKEKKRLMLERANISKEFDNVSRYSKYYATTYTNLAQASIAYAKERTLEHADAMYEALYHIAPPIEK